MIPTIRFVRFKSWWMVTTSEGVPIGTIKWNTPWKRYSLQTFHSILDTTQMAVIVDFITNAMEDLKV